MEFVDIAGLVRGASKGEGLGNQFLSHIRDVNAIIHVVRSFEEDNIAHVEGNLNPIRDIETELLIMDIATVEIRIEKLQKTARLGDNNSKEELIVLDFIYLKMNGGKLVRDIQLDANQNKYIQILALLINKPTLYVINVDENEINTKEQSLSLQQLFDFVEKKGDEVSAWIIKSGMFALKAAGEIYTDMERGFIKAEVYTFNDLMQYKSEPALKNAGEIKMEGKNYIVQDGNIIFFKFNV